MGFFDGIVDAVSKPIRGIGRIVRGKFREGFNDIGDGVSKAAPLAAWIPGVGAPVAAAMGGLGSLLEESTDDEKGVNWMKPVMGAASGFGSGKLAKHMGGVSGIINAGKAGGLRGIGKLALEGAGASGGGGAAAATTEALPQLASKGAEAGAASGVGSVARGGSGLDTLTKAALLSQGAGAAANAYGAHQMGEAEDERLEFERGLIEEQRGRNQALDPVRADILRRILESLNAAATSNAPATV